MIQYFKDNLELSSNLFITRQITAIVYKLKLYQIMSVRWNIIIR